MAKQGSLSLLEVNPGLVLWTFITFGLVLFLLHRFAWRPIAKALDSRAAKVHNDLKQAEDLKKEAEQKLGEYIKKLDEFKEENEQLQSKSRKEAEEIRQQLIAQAKEEAASLLERNRKEILEAKNLAIQDIHQQIVNYAMVIATQILERELQSQDHEKLTRGAVKAIQDLQGLV